MNTTGQFGKADPFPARFASAVILAVVMASCAAPGSRAKAQQPQICWIEHVLQTSDGLDIYFNKVKTRVARGRGWEDMPSAVMKSGDAEMAYSRVSAQLGDKLFLANSPEDGCSIEIVTRDGKIGVKAQAFFNPPGLPPASAEAFIPAEPIRP